MDAGYQLEQAFKRFSDLSDTKRRKLLENTAGMFERAIGNEACSALAAMIDELVEEHSPKKKASKRLR